MVRRLDQLDDQRLAKRVRAGDQAAFEVLYDRHHKALLAYCRHMLGNVQDGEDALQQTFIRAHRALLSGPLPDTVKPWLFAIARNRCKTMLAARREATVSVEDHEPSFEGLSDDVARRADLRELVTDLARLPEDQRGALVLFELGGLSQAEIATAIGVPAGKVKALVFQARSELMAERDARQASCDAIREELAVARGGALRRGPLKRHLRQCDPCDAYRVAVAAQRTSLASIMPVAPALGLKAAILAAAAGGNGAAAGLAGGAGAGAGLHDGGASVFGGAGAGKGAGAGAAGHGANAASHGVGAAGNGAAMGAASSGAGTGGAALGGAAASGAATGSGGAAAASTGGVVATGLAATGGSAVMAVVAKVAVTAAIVGGGAAGSAAVVERASEPAGVTASATITATPEASPEPSPTVEALLASADANARGRVTTVALTPTPTPPRHRKRPHRPPRALRPPVPRAPASASCAGSGALASGCRPAAS